MNRYGYRAIEVVVIKPVKPESPDEVFLQFVNGSERTSLDHIHQLFLHHSRDCSVVTVVVLCVGCVG